MPDPNPKFQVLCTKCLEHIMSGGSITFRLLADGELYGQVEEILRDNSKLIFITRAKEDSEPLGIFVFPTAKIAFESGDSPCSLRRAICTLRDGRRSIIIDGPVFQPK